MFVGSRFFSGSSRDSHSKFRGVTVRMRCAFTPPPRRGSENSEPRDSSDSSILSQHHLFIQRLGQDFNPQDESAATQFWLFMQTIVYFYQLIKKLISKSKHATGHVVNLIQVKIQFVQNVNIIEGRNQERQGRDQERQPRNQERQGRNQSHHNQKRQTSGQKCAQIMSYVLFYSFFMLFAIS